MMSGRVPSATNKGSRRVSGVDMADPPPAPLLERIRL
jgi:hypothetical protein